MVLPDFTETGLTNVAAEVAASVSVISNDYRILANGFANREISPVLGTGHHTAKSHVVPLFSIDQGTGSKRK